VPSGWLTNREPANARWRTAGRRAHARVCAWSALSLIIVAPGVGDASLLTAPPTRTFSLVKHPQEHARLNWGLSLTARCVLRLRRAPSYSCEGMPSQKSPCSVCLIPFRRPPPLPLGQRFIPAPRFRTGLSRQKTQCDSVVRIGTEVLNVTHTRQSKGRLWWDFIPCPIARLATYPISFALTAVRPRYSTQDAAFRKGFIGRTHHCAALRWQPLFGLSKQRLRVFFWRPPVKSAYALEGDCLTRIFTGAEAYGLTAACGTEK